MKDSKEISPIAYIYNDFEEKFGIPRQSGKAPSVISRIVFLPEYRDPEAIRSLDGFSHIWLLFGFSKAETNKFSPTVRPPRLGGNTKVGVFASRSPYRPNGIGLSSVKLVGIEDSEKGKVLVVSGADLLSDTPIYDIKPYLVYSDSHPDAISGYTENKDDYELTVDFPPHLKEKIPENMLSGITECLKEDPRPSYQEDPERIYGMRFGKYNIKFKVEGKILKVVEVEI